MIKKNQILQGNFDKKIAEIESELRRRCENNKIESIRQIGIFEQKINKLERNAENKSKGIFEMVIDDFELVRYKYEFWSEYFSPQYCPYRMRLNIYPSTAGELRIQLYICDDVMNQYFHSQLM